MSTSPRLPTAVTVYVAVWLAATIAVLTPTAIGAIGESADLVGIVVLGALVAVAEMTELRFRFSKRLLGAFTLIEAAVSATLLLLPASSALVAVGGGALVANLLRRRSVAKVCFNTSQVAMSAFAAAAVLAVLPEFGPVVGRHGIGTLAIAMTVYDLVNMSALMGLLRLLSADVASTLRNQGWLSVAALIGGLPVGILGAELSASRPELVGLLVAPAASVFLAYRGVSRTQQLLAQVRGDHDRLDRIVAGTSDGILLLGADGTIEVWNEALTGLTGIPGTAAVGQPVERILHGVRLGDPVSGAWRLDDATPTTPTLIDQAQLRHLIDGTVHTVRESHTFRFEDDRCVGDVVVITDITREQEVADLKTDFVARVSHELRTPLTPIKGFASMLLKRGPEMDDEQRRSALERIVERSERMASLVDDLLMVTELGRDDDHTATSPALPAREPLDIVAVVHDVARTVGREAGRDDIGVESAEPVTAQLDTDKLAQVLRHLLDNALRYSAPGTPVTVTVGRAGDRLRLDVADRGRGIPGSEQERVFEPFLRLEDPLRMTTSGVGVGLYIARRLAREMDGDVTVQSRPGAGSTFTVELPACPASAPERQPSSSVKDATVSE